jgi:uncharacterized protein YecT (DUF1311 family)
MMLPAVSTAADSEKITDEEYKVLLQNKDFREAEQELNNVYKQVMAQTDPEDKKDLKASQLQWLKHRARDAYRLFGKGTPEYVKFLTQVTYDRASYLDKASRGAIQADAVISRDDVQDIKIKAKPKFYKSYDGSRVFRLEVTDWMAHKDLADGSDPYPSVDWTVDLDPDTRHCFEDAEISDIEVEAGGTLLIDSFGRKYIVPITAFCIANFGNK